MCSVLNTFLSGLLFIYTYNLSCPLSLFILIHLTLSGSLSNSYIHGCIFSPTRHFTSLLQNASEYPSFKYTSSVSDSVQVSEAYVSIGLTSILIISVLVSLDIKCYFRCFLNPSKHLFADKIRFCVSTPI
jgi:hypothetical protein